MTVIDLKCFQEHLAENTSISPDQADTHCDQTAKEPTLTEQTDHTYSGRTVDTNPADTPTQIIDMAFRRQFLLLMWKIGLQQRRKKWMTVFEIILPLVFTLIVMSQRITGDKPVRHEAANSNFSYSVYNQSQLPYIHTLVYTPNSTLINKLMVYVSKIRQRFGYYVFRAEGFRNSEDMEAFFNKNAENIGGVVEFMDIKMEDKRLPKNLRFAIRPPVNNYFQVWKTNVMYPSSRQWKPRPTWYPDYEYQGFLLVQRLIHDVVIWHWNPNASATLEGLTIHLQRMPYPSYVDDGMTKLLEEILPALFMLSFIFIAVQTTKDIVDEKEKKLKESMKLMGLSAAAHWMSWFVFRFLQMIIIMALFTLFCCLNASGKGAPLLKSDPSVIFMFLLCYGVAIISFCFMISVFVKKGSTAAAISGIFFVVSYSPYLYIQYALRVRLMTLKGTQAACLVFNLGMAFGAYIISQYEGFDTGVQWSNIHQAPSSDSFPLRDAMLMLLLDTVIHLAITWYVDNVRPGEFGVPKPWYFPFTKAYWCGSKRRQASNSVAPKTDNKHGISIKNLKKVFGSGRQKTVAVGGADGGADGGVNLNAAKDQITVLLGQNGAGKTTTMSILTGFIPPTDGEAFVNGYNINTDIQSVRRSLGLCPQHNILFDTLTVQEHLEFFASLKGCSRRDQKTEAENMIQDVGLSSKRNTQSQHLSGGQQRKLSVGIALIGGSKIVILDEPTSGMDPAARRQTWDILQRNRQGRTMLLTTHFMDEADLLGDKIAIMADGVIKCCDTSHNLKKRYEAGYHLVIVKGPTCKVTSVTRVVQRHINTANLESEINAELSYLLPQNQSSQFAGLFTEIENRSVDLGISSFGITATTMEDVFIKVVNGEGAGTGAVGNNFAVENLEFTKLTGCSLELSRIKGLLVKKLLHSWRNRAITIIQFLFPLCLTIFALAIANSSKVEEVALTLDLSPFRGSYVPYWNSNATTPFTKALEKAYSGQFSGTNNKVENPEDLNSRKTYFLTRAKELGLDSYNKKMVVGAAFVSDKNISAFYNEQPYHAEPISLSCVMNAILKHFTSEDYSITTIIKPMPKEISVTSSDAFIGNRFISFIIAFAILFGMAFLTSSFVHLSIKERQVGAKHLQLLTGVRPLIFWACNFFWEFVNYVIIVLLLLIVFLEFQIPAYTDDGRLGILSLVFVVYGLAALPFMNTLQYIFRSPAVGIVVISLLNIFTGMATFMGVHIMIFYDQVDEAKTLDWIFSAMFSNHNFGKCIQNMYVNYINLAYCVGQNYTRFCPGTGPCCKDTCEPDCLPFVEDYLDWEAPGIGRYITFMLIHASIFTIITLSIEYRIPQRVWYRFQRRRTNIVRRGATLENEDITSERRRVGIIQIGHESSDPLVLRDLSKCFGNCVAVDSLSARIAKRECFGLIGQNAAGKTSTFKMLTGDLRITSGNAYLFSYDIKTDTRKVQENMGYCPQFDALLDHMTGRETLTMYARLKGVPKDSITDVCGNLLKSMDLDQYADKLTSEYSGGNKRKLSTAVALVGNPAVIILDEPSTGMDPKARRGLWNVLSQVREWGRTLVLTSHSMEECDALCTRIAIMVNGRFMCLGTPQHLKNTFGQGYTLIVRMAIIQNPPGMAEERGPAPLEPLIQFIRSHYPNTQVFDDHRGYVHFQVPNNSVSLAQVFTLMEQAKVQFSVEDYSVHQTTLEEVFLYITNGQTVPAEPSENVFRRIFC